MKKLFFPFFDSLEYLESTGSKILEDIIVNKEDLKHAISFLKSYKGSLGTFNSYRREIERLFQWCFLIAGKSITELKRSDIEEFIKFCMNPPKSWIGTKKAPRFIEIEGERVPNAEWKPFVATVTKIAHQRGERPNPKEFELSHASIKETFAILSTFYNYLCQEEYALVNPVILIRQKSKFIRRTQGHPKIRRLSETQWYYVMKTSDSLAKESPEKYERVFFMMSALYSMYLRISELAASKRWSPSMNHFFRDGDGNWWFLTVGKGNKQRQIAVSNAMLESLKRWRGFLGLTSLPSSSDTSPLLPKSKGKGPITSTTYIRRVLQECFDETIKALKQDGLMEEADSLGEVTVHWLRHTGISDDVKHRPREHVRDDAGHSSSAITDKYIDIELKERHKSAQEKPIIHENESTL